MEHELKTDKLLRRTQVEEITALSRATIYRKIANGTFPAPVNIGGGVRWKLSDIQSWMDGLTITTGGN